MKRKNALILGGVLLLAAAGILLTPLRWRVYPFARVHGTVTVTMNGREIAFTLISDKNNEKVSPDRCDAGDGSIWLHAKDYGSHGITVYPAAAHAVPADIQFFFINWWSAADFSLQIDETEDADGSIKVKVSGECSLVDDDGKWETQKVNEEYAVTEDMPAVLIRFSGV